MHITARTFLHIPMHLVLRDEHPELIERYHTNGAHAIPKLVMFDRETGEELAVWGPRPEPAQTMVLSAKAGRHSARRLSPGSAYMVRPRQKSYLAD